MANFKLPYYKGHIDCNIPDELVAAVLTSKTEDYVPEKSESNLMSMMSPACAAMLICE